MTRLASIPKGVWLIAIAPGTAGWGVCVSGLGGGAGDGGGGGGGNSNLYQWLNIV